MYYTLWYKTHLVVEMTRNEWFFNPLKYKQAFNVIILVVSLLVSYLRHMINWYIDFPNIRQLPHIWLKSLNLNQLLSSEFRLQEPNY